MANVTQDAKEFLWVQKFRPKTISECILPSELEATFSSISQQDRIPSLLLSGGAGVGKTTVAKALCDEVGADWMIINGSEENGIDVLRTKIKGFASTVSFTGSKKVVIIDEADYLNPNSIQPALRAFSEEFSKNCTFILTCNYRNRIIAPLQSRFTPIEFKIPAGEKTELAVKFLKRAMEILKLENVDADKKAVAALIQKYFPDYRRVLNELQRYSVSGKIDEGVLINLGDDSFNELMKILKEKAFNKMRQWVAQHSDVDSVKLYSDLYNKAADKLEAKSIPELILILAKYQYQAAFVADAELNNVACLTEIMMGCSFK